MQVLTERAVLKRINRKLAPSIEMVGRHRGPYTKGRYYHKDDRSLLGEFDDLESFAREIGVMTTNQRIA